MHALAAIVQPFAVKEVTAHLAEGVDDIEMDPVLNADAILIKTPKTDIFRLDALPGHRHPEEVARMGRLDGSVSGDEIALLQDQVDGRDLS